MRLEASVEVSELEGYLCKEISKGTGNVDVVVDFCLECKNDYIQATNEQGVIVYKEQMKNAFDLVKKALFTEAALFNIDAYEPTEEGFVFTIS